MKQTISNTAKQIGISQGFFSNILAGRRRPHYRVGKDIARITGTSVDIWMEGSPEEMQEAWEAYATDKQGEAA